MTPVGLEAWPHPELCGKGGQFIFKKQLPENKKIQDTSAAMLFQAAVTGMSQFSAELFL